MAKKLRTVQDIKDSFRSRVYPNSPQLRKILDRNTLLNQWLNLTGTEYENAYNEFVKQYEKDLKGKDDVNESRSLMTLESGKKVQERTATKVIEKNAGFRQIKSFYNKLIPELSQNYDVGHKYISVIKTNIAIGLAADKEQKYLTDAERSKLLALLKVCERIDAITEVPEGVDFNDLMPDLLNLMEHSLDLEVDYNKLVDFASGKLTGDMSLEYGLETEELNRKYKGGLAKLVGMLLKDIIEFESKRFDREFERISDSILDLKGSPTIFEDLEQSFLVDLTKDLDVKTNFTAKKPKKTKATASSTGTKRKTARKQKKKKLRKANLRGAAGQMRGPASEPLRLIGLMNQQLPGVVAKNMGPPRLTNRTGRFAGSVKVVDVMQTPQGFPSFGYTYRKNPYQTFEVGFAQGSTQLDPRRLIDTSIREIAAKAAIGRLYTRRV